MTSKTLAYEVAPNVFAVRNPQRSRGWVLVLSWNGEWFSIDSRFGGDSCGKDMNRAIENSARWGTTFASLAAAAAAAASVKI